MNQTKISDKDIIYLRMKAAHKYLRLNISAKMHPMLHMSTAVAYVDWRSTSGARYHNVTTLNGYIYIQYIYSNI